MAIDWVRVKSSNLYSIAYDAETRTLYIKFKSRSVYAYHDVSRYRYNGLRNAGSKGQYFDQNVKENYAWDKIS